MTKAKTKTTPKAGGTIKEQKNVGEARMIPWNKLKYEADERGELTPESLRELAVSIAEIGVRVPLIVDEQNRVVDGRRRYAALGLLIKENNIPQSHPLPCVVGTVSDAESVETRVVANLLRENLPAIQLCRVVVSMVAPTAKEAKASQRDRQDRVGKALGKSGSWVQQCQTICKETISDIQGWPGLSWSQLRAWGSKDKEVQAKAFREGRVDMPVAKIDSYPVAVVEKKPKEPASPSGVGAREGGLNEQEEFKAGELVCIDTVVRYNPGLGRWIVFGAKGPRAVLACEAGLDKERVGLFLADVLSVITSNKRLMEAAKLLPIGVEAERPAGVAAAVLKPVGVGPKAGELDHLKPDGKKKKQEGKLEHVGDLADMAGDQ